MRVRLCDLTLLALALAACDDAVPFPTHAEPRGVSFAEHVGVATGLAWGTSDEAKALRAAQLGRLATLGVKRVRMDFTWHRLEPTPGEWKFEPLDAVVNDARATGISILAICAYGNPAYPSAAGQGQGTQLPGDDAPEALSPPTDPAHYARYVAAVAERYGAEVREYELWNEQNVGYRFWRPGADAAAYGRLARAAAEAGRAACADCRFVLGGVAMPQPIPEIDLYPIGPVFLADVYASQPALNTWIDAVAFHPYQYPKDAPERETAVFPDQPQGSLASQAGDIASIVGAGEGAPPPIWITENGWSTNPGIPETDEDVARVFGITTDVVSFGRGVLGDERFRTVLETVRGVGEADQARYLVRSIAIGLSLGVERTFVFTLDDNHHDPAMNQEAAFGLFRVDRTPKPAVGAIAATLGRFGELRFAADAAAQLGLAEPDRALLFTDGSRDVLALWRWKDGTRELTLEDLPGEAELISMDGRVVAGAPRGDELRVVLGPDVQWVSVKR